jgi:hypothetical protein
LYTTGGPGASFAENNRQTCWNYFVQSHAWIVFHLFSSFSTSWLFHLVWNRITGVNLHPPQLPPNPLWVIWGSGSSSSSSSSSIRSTNYESTNGNRASKSPLIFIVFGELFHENAVKCYN